MRRHTLFVMCALGTLLTTWQNPVVQSSRDADFDANGIVGFGITQRAEPPQSIYAEGNDQRQERRRVGGERRNLRHHAIGLSIITRTSK